MATQADVRKIALSLPDTEENVERFGFNVLVKGTARQFVWVWKERVVPKKPRVPNPEVLAVRVANLMDKDLLLQSDPKKFFTEPHYNGYPAVLVRLKEIKVPELRALMKDSYEIMASPPKAKKRAK